MKKLINILILVIFCQGNSLALLQSEKPKGWKGKIKYINGIKLVTNPKKPLFGEFHFKLEEDLSIGSKQDKNSFFDRVYDLDVDAEGNIYILDMNNRRVQKFNKNGEYKTTYGSSEIKLEQPLKIRISHKSENVFIQDWVDRLKIFSNEGNFQRKIILNGIVSDFYSDENERLLVVLWTKDDSKDYHSLCTVSRNGEVLKKMITYPYTLIRKKVSNDDVLFFLGHELSIQLSRLLTDKFVYAYSKEYILNIIDNQAKILFKIKKEETRPEFSDREKLIFTKRNIDVPTYKPFIYSIKSDEDGWMYVQRNRIVREENTEVQVDIFSSDGYFLYHASLPNNTLVIKNGFIYAYMIDDDNYVEYVKRYKIRNWNKFKRNE